MEKRKLGRSGIEVSPLSLGCWALAGGSGWGDQDERSAIATIHAALDQGINFFDTAEGYGDGLSEEIVGKALADRRDRAVIASKISPNHTAPDAPRPSGKGERGIEAGDTAPCDELVGGDEDNETNHEKKRRQ